MLGKANGRLERHKTYTYAKGSPPTPLEAQHPLKTEHPPLPPQGCPPPLTSELPLMSSHPIVPPPPTLLNRPPPPTPTPPAANGKEQSLAVDGQSEAQFGATLKELMASK